MSDQSTSSITQTLQTLQTHEATLEAIRQEMEMSEPKGLADLDLSAMDVLDQNAGEGIGMWQIYNTASR